MLPQVANRVSAHRLRFGGGGWFVYLGSVGQEYGRGQIARDAAQDVNDGDAQPASQLLQVPQDGHLESHGHQAVEDPGRGGEKEAGAQARAHDDMCALNEKKG